MSVERDKVRCQSCELVQWSDRVPCYGDPEYTFSDVERAIQREIVDRNYLAQYELRLAEKQQATNLALLRQSENRYRAPVGDSAADPT